MIIQFIYPCNGTDVHAVKNRKHQSHPSEKVSGCRIQIFNSNGYSSKNRIHSKKIQSTESECFEKNRCGIKDAGTQYQKVHKEDVRNHDPYKNQGLLFAVPLHGHKTKIQSGGWSLQIFASGLYIFWDELLPEGMNCSSLSAVYPRIHFAQRTS